MKPTYWLADESGTVAAVEGADRRDDMLRHGWTVVDEPTGDTFVWVHHPDVANPARVPAAGLDAFTARGWRVGRPAEAAATDIPPEPKPKAAAGTNSKES
ncbi:MAG TPA: hypothetical protein VFX60_19360 [Micromonospora sp.]|nr:hypothetical protein [Micromonospora sp.]